MKKLLLALAAVLLVLPLYAAEPGNPEPVNIGDQDFLASLSNPDLGVPDVLPAQVPPCPTNVACTSPIGPCAISLTCTVTNLGPCCMTSSGLQRCCLHPNNILVTSCPCAGAGCPSAQITSKCG